METSHAIRTLRTVRRFRPDPLPDVTVTAILDAGRHAGSSKNQQRWAFIPVADRSTLDRLGAIGPYAEHIRGAPLGIALITPDPYAPDAALSILWDLGRAAQNMTLAAWALGVGSCPVTVYEHDLCREILGYPSDHHCEYAISFGYPADPTDLTRPPRAGGRLDLASVVHGERW